MNQYIKLFSTLHVNKQRGQVAPHKAVMLLSVMDLVANGAIVDNRIEFSERLEEQFKRNWDVYVRKDTCFRPIAGTPFWHMHYEDFWTLRPYIGGEGTIAELQKSNPYSSRSLRENIRYAEIDKELFLLMQIPEQRQMLRQILISTYLTDEKGNDKHKGDILLACLCFPVLMWLGQPQASSRHVYIHYNHDAVVALQMHTERSVIEKAFYPPNNIIVA